MSLSSCFLRLIPLPPGFYPLLFPADVKNVWGGMVEPEKSSRRKQSLMESTLLKIVSHLTLLLLSGAPHSVLIKTPRI